MANKILIVGDSGKGKSTSMRNLSPESTFIVNVENKELPWRGFKKSYKSLSKENPEGNMISTDNTETILKVMDKVNNDMPHIKVLVIDDAQYIMANEYMRKAMVKGYEKYSEIGRNFFLLIDRPKSLRDDLTVIFMMHSEVIDDGMGNKTQKAKTIGRMIDSAITLEGKFTVVLYADVEKGKDGNKYYFNTQNNGANTCKSPIGMFKDDKIPNDLAMVIEAMNQYNEE